MSLLHSPATVVAYLPRPQGFRHGDDDYYIDLSLEVLKFKSHIVSYAPSQPFFASTELCHSFSQLTSMMMHDGLMYFVALSGECTLAFFASRLTLLSDEHREHHILPE